MTPYLPTPQEFLERPEPADDGDLIDPLVSIAASLAQLVDAMSGPAGVLYPLPGDAAAGEELAQNLRETAADLEDKLQAAAATLAQIEAVVKPSTSKLANAVRAELARWRGEAPEPGAAAEPEPEEPVEDQVGYVGPVASVPEQPAPDAPVEEWRAYVRARGYTSPHIDLLNRSQIRSLLGIPQPV